MKLYLMSGPPGSGKSAKARLIARDKLAVILSTDDFHHTDPNNPHLYLFENTRAGECHLANQERCRYFMQKGVNVIIDNTNLTNRQIGPYVRLAREFGFDVEIVYCEGDYGSVHGVPAEVIEKMRKIREPLDPVIALTAEPL
jgi:predicted kinase